MSLEVYGLTEHKKKSENIRWKKLSLITCDMSLIT